MTMVQPPSSGLELQLKAEPRDPKLNTLLDKLAELDPLFHYNVPAKVREGYDNQALFAHLQQVYSQPEFVMEDPEVIKRYIQAGDRVRKKGEFKKTTWSVQPGDKGSTRGYGPTIGEVKVQFGLHSLQVDKKELVVLGKEGFFKDTLYDKKQQASSVHSISKCNYLVEYHGEPYEENEICIPDGTEGIVWKDDRDSSPLVIAWERGPRVRMYNSSQGKDYSHQTVYWQYQEVKLVRKNNIDFKALSQQILDKQEEKK